MNELQHFSFRTPRWKCVVRFFDDRIEYTWARAGLGRGQGAKTVLKSQVQSRLGEVDAFGHHARASLNRAGVCMMVGVVVYSSAPDSAMRWAILAFSAAAVFGVLGLIRLRRDSWLNIQKLDGSPAIALDVTKWTQAEVEEFTTYYLEWTRKGPNQRVQGAPDDSPSSSSEPEGRLAG